MTTERCAAAERCTRFDRREQLAGVTETGPLCEGCLLAGELAVPALVLDFRDLEQQIPVGLGMRGDGRGSGDPSVPMRLDVAALQDEIWWLATAWEEIVRDMDRLSTPELRWAAHESAPAPRLLRGVEVQRAVGILAHRVRQLSRVPSQQFWRYPPTDGWSEVSGAQGLVDLTRAHRRAMAVQGLNEARPEPCAGVPCRVCDLKALFREPGEDWVRCGSCGAHYSATDYRTWTRLVSAHAVRTDTPQADSLPL